MKEREISQLRLVSNVSSRALVSPTMQSVKRQAMLPCVLMLSYANDVVSRPIVMKYAVSCMLCVVVSPGTPVSRVFPDRPLRVQGFPGVNV